MMAAISFGLMIYSLSSLPESISNAIFMTFPFFVTIAAFTYTQEMMSRIQIICIGGAYIGVLIITNSQFEQMSFKHF